MNPATALRYGYIHIYVHPGSKLSGTPLYQMLRHILSTEFRDNMYLALEGSCYGCPDLSVFSRNSLIRRIQASVSKQHGVSHNKSRLWIQANSVRVSDYPPSQFVQIYPVLLASFMSHDRFLPYRYGFLTSIFVRPLNLLIIVPVVASLFDMTPHFGFRETFTPPSHQFDWNQCNFFHSYL
jgi:hypothetical protein